MTPPTKDNHPTLSFREMTEKAKEQLVETALEEMKERAARGEQALIEYKDKTRRVTAVRLRPSLDKDLETETLQMPNKAPMVSTGASDGRLHLPEDTHLEELEAPPKGETVGESWGNSFEADPTGAGAFLELQRVAAEAARDVAEEYGVGCSANPRRVWAETAGTNPTPLEDLQCYEGRFGDVGEDEEE